MSFVLKFQASPPSGTMNFDEFCNAFLPELLREREDGVMSSEIPSLALQPWLPHAVLAL